MSVEPVDDGVEYEGAFVGLTGNEQLYRHVCDRVDKRAVQGPLSHAERIAVWLYATTSGFWYRDINTPLREHSDPPEYVQPIIDILRRALQKLPVHNGQVYRGIRVQNLDALVDEYEPSYDGQGNEVVWHSFSSSSIDPDQAVEGNVLFIIESNDGRVLGAYADLPAEQEVVFLPGSRFRVQGLERTATRAIISLRQLAPFGAAHQFGG